MSGTWNTEKDSLRQQRFSYVSENSSTCSTENMYRERAGAFGDRVGTNAYYNSRSNGDVAGYGTRKDVDQEHNESSNSDKEDGVGDLPATYVPFGTRPKQIQPLKEYSDSDGEDNEDDRASFDSRQPQQQEKQRLRLSAGPNEAQEQQKLQKQKSRDYEIDYEHRPWKRNPSYTSYSSKNSRGSKSSKTSRGSSASRKIPVTHFSQYTQQQQQQPQQSNTATSISSPRKQPMSSNDSQEDSVSSFLSQSIHSFESSDESSITGRERNKSVKAKGNILDNNEEENSDSNHSPPSLDKISAIVDQVHREKQSRLASLQDGNVPVGKLPGGRNVAEPDVNVGFGVDSSTGKNQGIRPTSSFKRRFTGGHAVSIGDTTNFGDEGGRTRSRGTATNQSFNISKLRNNKGGSVSGIDFDRRISLQKESSLRKVTVDVASIASREVEKFYSKRKQEKLEQKQLEMQQRCSDLRFSVERSESVARLKQADLWSSLNLGESEVELMRKKVLRSSTSSYRMGENYSEDFNDSVDFGDDDAYEFDRIVATHEQESIGDERGIPKDDSESARNLISEGRDSENDLCGEASPIGKSGRSFGHERENVTSQIPPVNLSVSPKRSSKFMSSSPSSPRSSHQPLPLSDAGESETTLRNNGIAPPQTPPLTTQPSAQSSLFPTTHETSLSAESSISTADMKTSPPASQSHLPLTEESPPPGLQPFLPTVKKMSPPSQSSSLYNAKERSSEMTQSSFSPTIEPQSPTQTSFLSTVSSSDTSRAAITKQPLRSISSSSTARYIKRTSLEMVLEAASRASMTGDVDDFAACPIDDYEDSYDRYDGGVQNAATVTRVMSFTSYNSGRSYNSEPVLMKRGARSTCSNGDNGAGGSGFVAGSSLVDESKSFSSATVRRQSLPCKSSKVTARRPARNKTIPSGDDYSHDGTNESGGAGTIGGSVTFSYKDIYGSSEEDLNFISDFPSVMLSSVGATSSSQYWRENGMSTPDVDDDDIAGVNTIRARANVGRNQEDEDDDYGFGRRRSSNLEEAESDNARSSMVSIGLDKSNRSLGSSRQSFGSHISADELDKLIEEEEEVYEPKGSEVKESTSWVKSLKRMSWLPVEMMQQHQQHTQPQQPMQKQRKTHSMYDLHDSDSDGSSKFGSSCSSFSSHSEFSCFSNGDMKPMSKDKRRRRRERRRRRKQLNKRAPNLVKESPAPRSIRDILTSTNTGYDTAEEEDAVSVKSSLPSLAAALGLDKELGNKSSRGPKRRGSHSSQSIQSNSVHSNASRSSKISSQQAVMQSHQQLNLPLSEFQPINPQQKKSSNAGVYFDDRGWRTGGVDYETSEEDLLAGDIDFTSQSLESSNIADGTVDSTGWERRPNQYNCGSDYDKSIRGHEELDRIPSEPDYFNETMQKESVFRIKQSTTSNSVKSSQDLLLDQTDLSFKERIDELRRSSRIAVEDEDPAAFMGVAPQSEKMKNLLKMLQSDNSVSDNEAEDCLNDSFAIAVRGDSSRPFSDQGDGGNERYYHSHVSNSALFAEEYNSNEAKPSSYPLAAITPSHKDGNSSMESKRDSHVDNGPPSRRLSATSQTSSTQSSHSNNSQLSHSEDAQTSRLGEVGVVSADLAPNQRQCKQVKIANVEAFNHDDESSSSRSNKVTQTARLSQRQYLRPNSSEDFSSLHVKEDHFEFTKCDRSRQTSTVATPSSIPGFHSVSFKPEDYERNTSNHDTLASSFACDTDMPLSSGYHQPMQLQSSGIQCESDTVSLHGEETENKHSLSILHNQINDDSVASTSLSQELTLQHEFEIPQMLQPDDDLEKSKSPHLLDCEETTIRNYPHHYIKPSLYSEADTSSQSKPDHFQNSQPNLHENPSNQLQNFEDDVSIQSATRNRHALQHNDPGFDIAGSSPNFSNKLNIPFKSDHCHPSKYNCVEDQSDLPHFEHAELSRSDEPQRSERKYTKSTLESMPNFEDNAESSSKSESSKAPHTILSDELESTQHSDHDTLKGLKYEYHTLSQPHEMRNGPVSPQHHHGVDVAAEHPNITQLESQPSDAEALLSSTAGHVDQSSPGRQQCAPVSLKVQDDASLASRPEHHSPLQSRHLEGTTRAEHQQLNPNPPDDSPTSPQPCFPIAEKLSRLRQDSPQELLESPKRNASPSRTPEKRQFLHSDQLEQSNRTIYMKETTQVRDDSLSVKSERLQNSQLDESDATASLSRSERIHQNEEDEKKKLPFFQLFNRSNRQKANSKDSLDEGRDANSDISIKLMPFSADLSQSCSSFGVGSKNGQVIFSRFKNHHSFDNFDDASKFRTTNDLDETIASNYLCETIIPEGLNDSPGQIRHSFGIFPKKDSNDCTASDKVNGGESVGPRESSSQEIQTADAIADHMSADQPVDQEQVVPQISTLIRRTTEQNPEHDMSGSLEIMEENTKIDQSSESEAGLTIPKSRFLGRFRKGCNRSISNGKDQLYDISDANEFAERSDTHDRPTRENSNIDDTITPSHDSANMDPSVAGGRVAMFGLFRKNRTSYCDSEGKGCDNCRNSGDDQTTGILPPSRNCNNGVSGSYNENSKEQFHEAFSVTDTDPIKGTHGEDINDVSEQRIPLFSRFRKSKTEREGKGDISSNGNDEANQREVLSLLNTESLNQGKTKIEATSQQFFGSQSGDCCAVGFEVIGGNIDEMSNLHDASLSPGSPASTLKSPNTHGLGGYSTTDTVENKPEEFLDTNGCTGFKDSLTHDKDTGPETHAGDDCDMNSHPIDRRMFAIEVDGILNDDKLPSCCDSSEKASVDSDFYIGTVIADTEDSNAEGYYIEDESYDFSNVQSSTAYLNHVESPNYSKPRRDNDESTSPSDHFLSNNLTSYDSRINVGCREHGLSPCIHIEGYSVAFHEGEKMQEAATNQPDCFVISDKDHDSSNDNAEVILSVDYCPSTDSEDEDVFARDKDLDMIRDEANNPSSEYQELQSSVEQVSTNSPTNDAGGQQVSETEVDEGHICHIDSHPDSKSQCPEDESSIDRTDVFTNYSSHVQPSTVGKDQGEAPVANTGDSSSDERKQSERGGDVFNDANDISIGAFLKNDDDSYDSSHSGGSVVWPKIFQNASKINDDDLEGSFSALHKQASQRSFVKEIFEDSDSGSDGNESVVWPKEFDLVRQPSGRSLNSEKNFSVAEYSQDSKYNAEYLVKTKTEVDDKNIPPEASPESLRPSISKETSMKSIVTMSTLDSLASPVDQMRAREQAAKDSLNHTTQLERRHSNSTFSSLESYASPTHFLRDNTLTSARNTFLNEEKTADDENALRHYREHYQDYQDSNASISAARKQSMTSELSYTYEIELREEFSEQLDELSTSIKGRDSRRFSFRPGRKSSIDSDGSESLESRDIFKSNGLIDDNNHFARSERSVVSRAEDLQASGFSNNFNMPGGSGMSVYSTDGIDDIDPNATDEGRDDFDFAMEAYANAMNFGHIDQRENDLEDNDHALAAKAYTGLGFARQCKGELDGALDAYMKSLQLWENEVGQDDPDNWDLQFTIGTVLKEMQRQLEASVHFNNALHLLKSRNLASGTHKGSILCTEGMIFSVMDKVDRALDCFRKSLLVLQETNHPLNLKFATIMFEMGSLLSQCEDYDDSANCYKFALEIRKARLGDSFLVARTYYSLGVTLASQEIQSNISTTSSSHLEEALRICQVEFEQNNLQSAIIIHALGVLNERKGDFLAASVWFTRERNMRKALLGPGTKFVYLCKSF
ncbi:hypothetical protein ACHAXS_012951 [Conticribra weissflogii]